MSDEPRFPPWSDDLHELTGRDPVDMVKIEDWHELTHPEIAEWVHNQLVFGVTEHTAGQIATQIQRWQVDQRASYQLTISRLQIELQQERGVRGHSAVDLERAVEGIREVLEEFWPRST